MNTIKPYEIRPLLNPVLTNFEARAVQVTSPRLSHVPSRHRGERQGQAQRFTRHEADRAAIGSRNTDLAAMGINPDGTLSSGFNARITTRLSSKATQSFSVVEFVGIGVVTPQNGFEKFHLLDANIPGREDGVVCYDLNTFWLNREIGERFMAFAMVWGPAMAFSFTPRTLTDHGWIWGGPGEERQPLINCSAMWFPPITADNRGGHHGRLAMEGLQELGLQFREDGSIEALRQKAMEPDVFEAARPFFEEDWKSVLAATNPTKASNVVREAIIRPLGWSGHTAERQVYAQTLGHPTKVELNEEQRAAFGAFERVTTEDFGLKPKATTTVAVAVSAPVPPAPPAMVAAMTPPPPPPEFEAKARAFWWIDTTGTKSMVAGPITEGEARVVAQRYPAGKFNEVDSTTGWQSALEYNLMAPAAPMPPAPPAEAWQAAEVKETAAHVAAAPEAVAPAAKKKTVKTVERRKKTKATVPAAEPAEESGTDEPKGLSVLDDPKLRAMLEAALPVG
jgi:hypothetical protein